METTFLRWFCAVLVSALAYSASSATRPAPTAPQPLRKASDLIRRQEPVKINQSLLKQATPDAVHVVVSLPKQRAYLMIGEQIVIDSPISSVVDSSGRIIRAGVSARIDSAPSGTRFEGAPMKWFMRLTGDGVGMHIGILPGYPASHGCIRMPADGAKLFYDHVKVGTPAVVGDY